MYVELIYDNGAADGADKKGGGAAEEKEHSLRKACKRRKDNGFFMWCKLLVWRAVTSRASSKYSKLWSNCFAEAWTQAFRRVFFFFSTETYSFPMKVPKLGMLRKRKQFELLVWPQGFLQRTVTGISHLLYPQLVMVNM